jgi:two-component system, OmpR family, alkaline phosphatase synthesis response regulator PhoP
MARILLVDDEPDMVQVWKLFLRRSGHEIEEAHDGLEALHITKTFLPDLIILDLMMPMAAGDLVLGFIRSTLELATTKVVVISAHPRGEQLASELGADGFLGKPVQMERFQTEVNRVLATIELKQ